jgi:hypothetical protein
MVQECRQQDTMSGAHTAAAIAARVRDPIRVWSLQEIHAKAVA